MATLIELCDANALEAVGGGLEAYEQPLRLLYAFPHVIEWLDSVLPALEPVLDEGRENPLDQAYVLIHDFVSGADLSYYQRSHSMKPEEPGVWELKTSDLRLFGWFVRRSVFVIAEIDSAAHVKEYNLYHGYLNSVVFRRHNLDLDEPKYITGGYEDVL